MKTLAWKIAALFVIVLLLPLFASAQEEEASYTIDRPIAVIDRQLITARDLSLWAFEERLYNPELRDAPPEAMWRLVVSDAIDEILLGQWAEKELEYPEVPEEQIEARSKDIRDRFEALAGGRTQLEELLADYGLKPVELRRWIRDRARENLLIFRAMMPRVGEKYLNLAEDAPDQAIRLRLGQIFIAPEGESERAWDAALERALTIRRNIAAGLSFSNAARLYSEDEVTRNQGGDLGWLRAKDLHPKLLHAVEEMEIGEVSQPVRTEHGFHILSLLDYETPARLKFRRAMTDEERRILQGLRDERDIRLAEGYELEPVPEPATPGPPSVWDVFSDTLPEPAAETGTTTDTSPSPQPPSEANHPEASPNE